MAYSPSTDGTPLNRPPGVTNGPDGARSYYHDVANFTYRQFLNKAEVLSYLDTSAKRRGNFPIIINTGGTLTNGLITGGTNATWTFLNGQADSDLTLMITDANSIVFGVNKRYNVEDFGVLTTNTAAQNKTALQAAITYLNANGGGVLQMTGAYPCDGGIPPTNNVKIEGTSWSEFKGPASKSGTVPGTGGPANACFVITDTVNSLFVGGSSVGFSIRNVGFNYPNQPIATTDVSTLIQYPPIISFGIYTYNVTLENLWYVGAWKGIEFTDECADLYINKVYGYALSGSNISIKNCRDIPRIIDCMFSPSMGNDFRTIPSVMPFFTVHSREVSAFVMNSTLANISLDSADEFQIRGCFTYTYGIFIKTVGCYGSIVQCSADVGRIGLYLSNGSDATKNTTVFGFSCIGSGGDNLADRNTIIVSGDGYYNFFGITPKLGTTPFSGLQNAGVNNNAVIKILNVGTPHVTVSGLKGTVYTGTFVHDIQNLNPNAVIEVSHIDVPNAVNKYIPAAKSLVVYDADMIGASGTNFSAYTAEIGTATSVLATATLDGNGSLQFNTSAPSQIVLPSSGLTNFRVSVLIKSLPTGGGAVSIQLSRTADGTGYNIASIGNVNGSVVNHNIQNELGVLAINNSYAATFPLIFNASVINGIIYTSINEGDILSAPVDRFVIDPRVTSQSGLVNRLVMDKVTFDTPKILSSEQAYVSGSFLKIRDSQTDIWVNINPQSPVANLQIEFPNNPYRGQLVDLTFGPNIRFGTVVSNLSITSPFGQSIRQPLAHKTGVSGVNFSYRYDDIAKGWAELGTPIELGSVSEFTTKFFVANMNGSSGTNFNSYTPELGTATTSSGAALLNGSGSLQFNTTSPGTTFTTNGSIPANRRVIINITSLPTGGGAVQVYMARSSDSTQYTLAGISNVNGTVGNHNIQDQNGLIISHSAVAISFPLTYIVEMIDGVLTSRVGADILSTSPQQSVQIVNIISIGGLIDSIETDAVTTVLSGFVTPKDIEITDITQGFVLTDTVDGLSKYRISVTNGVLVPNPIIFFFDTFAGSAGAYSGHTADKGLAYVTRGTINLDGSGNAVYANGILSTLSTSGVQPTDRRVTSIFTSVPSLQNTTIELIANGSQYVLVAFQVTSSGVGTLTIATATGNQSTLSGITFSGDITMLATKVGNLISASINGGTVITWTSTITGTDISNTSASSGATFRSLKVEPLS